MNQAQRIAAERTIGRTHGIVDQYKCLAALKMVKSEDKPEVIKMILEARLDWLNWHTITQRKWQRETKNVNKARHHDSISIRENYVRCHE